MKRQFQAILVKIAVNIGLLFFRTEILHLHFVHEKTNNISKLAEKHDVYIIRRNSISKYYIYGDPSRSLVCDDFYSLQDFIFNILTSSMSGNIVMECLKLSYNPHQTKDKILDKYLEKYKLDSTGSNIERNIFAMEISKSFYSTMYRRIDKFINNIFILKLNNYLFCRKTISENDLYGVWINGKNQRNYKKNDFSVTYILDNYLENSYQCSILYISNQMIYMKVITKEDKLDYDERLLLSNDGNSLIVYNYCGRSIWKRNT